MKRNIPVSLLVLCLSFLLSSPLLSQNPDGWEEYQTSLQPSEIVIPSIELKEGLVVGEIGAGRGRLSL